MRAVFADCHVGRRPDDDGPFLEALERAAGRGAAEISFLGDIFHFFIAHPKFETPAIARFLERVEARLYRSNFKHKQRLPVEMIRDFARRRFAEGVDVLLLGHFHRSWTEQIGSGRVEILPAFVDDRKWMEIADDGSTRLVGLSE